MRVVFVRYPIEPGHFASVVAMFREGMAARGYREGYEVEYIDILTRGSDLSAVPDVVAAVNRFSYMGRAAWSW